MSRTLSVVILALAACGEPEDTGPDFTQQAGGDGTEAVCNVVEETTLGADDVGGEFDFSPNDLLLQLEGTYGDQLEWSEYDKAGADVTITYDGGSMTYFDREIDGIGDLDMTNTCITATEVEVQMMVVSSDGLLNEVLDVTLVATVRDRATYAVVLEATNIMGTWTPE